jgi:LysM repeat protein
MYLSMTVRILPSDQQTPDVVYSDRTPRKRTGAFAGALARAQATGAAAPVPGETVTVRPGDTLYGIARQLKKTNDLPQSLNRLVKEMTDLNRLANPNRIFPGQSLRLPLAAGGPPPSPNPTPHLETAVPDPEPPTIVFLTELPELPAPAAEEAKAEMPPPELPASESSRQELPEALPVQAEDPVGEIPLPPVGTEGRSAALSLPSATMTPGTMAAQVAMYKEDQLLAHPGGDYYFLHRTGSVYDPSFDRSRFGNRVGKDLNDAGENLLNIARDLAMGSRFKYVGKDGEIKDGKRMGIAGTMKNFFEDLVSGVSFGAYTPSGEKAPKGIAPSLIHFFKKVFYDAPIKDLLVGVPHAGINIGKDAIFAALNLLQAVPDSTLGNFRWGQKLTTTVFDNGQVVVDYLTDVLPGSNAWLRVHAAGADGKMGLPVLYNLQTTEQGVADSRWATVRNTPFRKTIETLGSLLADGASALTVARRLPNSSSDQRQQ